MLVCMKVISFWNPSIWNWKVGHWKNPVLPRKKNKYANEHIFQCITMFTIQGLHSSSFSIFSCRIIVLVKCMCIMYTLEHRLCVFPIFYDSSTCSCTNILQNIKYHSKGYIVFGTAVRICWSVFGKRYIEFVECHQ